MRALRVYRVLRPSAAPVAFGYAVSAVPTGYVGARRSLHAASDQLELEPIATKPTAALAAAEEEMEEDDVRFSAYATSGRVYNPFSGNLVRVESKQILTLRRMGFTIADSELIVGDAARVNRFAARIAAATPEELEELTAGWPTRMRAFLVPVLGNAARDSNANAAATAGMTLRHAYNMRTRATLAAVVCDDIDFSDLDPLTLNQGQRSTLLLATQGLNLYIGGTAGTGKTELLRQIYTELRKLGKKVGMTATTGLAAANIRGVTFHKALGVRRDGEFRIPDSAIQLDALVVDEVSMMSKFDVDALDIALRKARMSPQEAFGGLQVIFSGDPLQLEAIPRERLVHRADGSAKVVAESKLFFEAPVFTNHVKCVALTEQVRQAGDTRFAASMAGLRRGHFSDELRSIVSMVDAGAPIAEDSVVLYPRNSEVSKYNTAKLESLPGEVRAFEPLVQGQSLAGEWTSSVLLRTKQGFSAQAFLANVLAAMAQKHAATQSADLVGYQFMIDGFVMRMRIPSNATPVEALAVKKRFAAVVEASATLSAGKAEVETVLENPEGLAPFAVNDMLDEMVKKHPLTQRLELKLGARVMLRQNLTSKLINGSVGKIVDFVPATAENIHIALRALPWCEPTLDTYASQQSTLHGVDVPLMPVVQFPSLEEPVAIPPMPIHVGGCALTYGYQTTTIAFPLLLAYSWTIHKAQGLTIKMPLRVCMENMWSCNHMVYVALSRAKAASQITVSGFKDELVRVNPKALQFDQTVTAAEGLTTSYDDIAMATRSDWYTAVERVPHEPRNARMTSNAALRAADARGASDTAAESSSLAASASGMPASASTAVEEKAKKVVRESQKRAAEHKNTQSKRMSAAKREARSPVPPLMLHKKKE